MYALILQYYYSTNDRHSSCLKKFDSIPLRGSLNRKKIETAEMDRSVRHTCFTNAKNHVSWEHVPLKHSRIVHSSTCVTCPSFIQDKKYYSCAWSCCPLGGNFIHTYSTLLSRRAGHPKFVTEVHMNISSWLSLKHDVRVYCLLENVAHIDTVQPFVKGHTMMVIMWTYVYTNWDLLSSTKHR